MTDGADSAQRDRLNYQHGVSMEAGVINIIGEEGCSIHKLHVATTEESRPLSNQASQQVYKDTRLFFLKTLVLHAAVDIDGQIILQE